MVRDPDTSQPIGFSPQAFEMKAGEDSLSASWIEFFTGVRRDAVDAAVTEFAGAYEIRKADMFALGQVSEIRNTFSTQNIKARIVHDGKGYPSHAAVRQIQSARLETLQLLASRAWAKRVVPSANAVAASQKARAARDR